MALRLSSIRNSDRILVLEAGKIIEEGTPEKLLSDESSRFYKLCLDQKLDNLSLSIASSPPSTPTTKTGSSMIPSRGVSLQEGSRSFSTADLTSELSNSNGNSQQETAKRQAWARASLGASKRFGRSYSIRSVDRLQKMTLPVMSRKRSMLDRSYSFRKNVLELPAPISDDEDPIDSEFSIVGFIFTFIN